MYKPSAENLRTNEEIITAFNGYNKNFKIQENEFSDDKSLNYCFLIPLFLKNYSLTLEYNGIIICSHFYAILLILVRVAQIRFFLTNNIYMYKIIIL